MLLDLLAPVCEPVSLSVCLGERLDKIVMVLVVAVAAETRRLRNIYAGMSRTLVDIIMRSLH